MQLTNGATAFDQLIRSSGWAGANPAPALAITGQIPRPKPNQWTESPIATSMDAAKH